jgi:hypothetical protein
VIRQLERPFDDGLIHGCHLTTELRPSHKHSSALLYWSFIINQAWYNAISKTHLGEQSNMVTETITLEDIKRRPLEEVLREVAKGSVNLVVQMPDGEEVVIEPKPRLKPLPVLEGYIPKGWKDAVYADK